MQKLPNPEEMVVQKAVLNPEEEVDMKSPKGGVATQSALTKKALIEYGPDVEENLACGESETTLSNCLKNHAIAPLLRAKMVNWMIEVLNTFECEDQAFFVAVGLMDLYFASSAKMLNADDVHLAGIVAMFIASKYVDYYPLKMKVVHEKIAHGSFAIESIKTKEREIMRTIKFCVTFPTVLNFIDQFIESWVFSRHGDFTQKHWDTLTRMRRICVYYGKLAAYDYHLLEYS